MDEILAAICEEIPKVQCAPSNLYQADLQKLRWPQLVADTGEVPDALIAGTAYERLDRFPTSKHFDANDR